MLAMRGRPMGRLFYLLLSIILTTAVSHSAPVMTRIVDTVFRADECLNASLWAKAK